MNNTSEMRNEKLALKPELATIKKYKILFNCRGIAM